MLRALLLAPPGAGKGTQGELLSERFGVPHIATGDLFRRQIADGTPVGDEMRAYVESGELVPDGLVTDLVVGTLDSDPTLDEFILDGYPRTLAQAHVGYEWAASVARTFTAVIMLVVPTTELVERLVERGRTSHRSDDDTEVIRHRLDVYDSNTAPLVDYYEKRDILLRIDGAGAVADVADRIVNELRAVGITPD